MKRPTMMAATLCWPGIVAAALIFAAPSRAMAAPADCPCAGRPAAPAALTKAIADYERFLSTLDAGGDGSPSDTALVLRDVTPAADAHRRVALVAIRNAVATLDLATLSDRDRLDALLLERSLDDRLAGLAFDEARMPFNSDGGFDSDLIYQLDRAKLSTPRDIDAYLALLRGIPAYYAANIDNARRGMRTGFTQPGMTVESVLARATREASATVDDRDPLLSPLATLPETMPLAAHAAIRQQALDLLRTQVRPAQARFVRFLTDDYLPKARPALSIETVPNGKAYYAYLVRRYTTTNVTPEQAHALGLQQVARIRAEMDGVIAQSGFRGTFAQFLAFLRTDPRFYATSRQQLIEKASEIAKRIDGRLPAHFGVLPRLPYGVQPVPTAIEEGYTTGRYFPGDPAKGIAGELMINTSHLDQRPLYELPALVLHEGVPGHHLQISLAQELTDIPRFRRDLYYSGFGEGWGLYSEWLGQEMGIYRDPYERFGRLSYEMWRACRLVADTGIHAMGWSLAKARACFTDNSALSPHNIDVELQRYVSWPGQALSYMIGEIAIRGLRREAEQALGDRFDERAFHDAVLLQGALPLDLLQVRVREWIAARKALPVPAAAATASP